jgi:predicted naringenin-chalcone synthase
MIWILPFSDALMAWALETARIWVLIFGCAGGGWALGFGMGYCRGVRDTVTDDIIRADHRVSGD